MLSFIYLTNHSSIALKKWFFNVQIIQDFLDWYKSLGGDPNETSIDESTLQELFQIGFDMPAAKALAIRIKEMPTVPESLANLRNEPQVSIYLWHGGSNVMRRPSRSRIDLPGSL